MQGHNKRDSIRDDVSAIRDLVFSIKNKKNKNIDLKTFF